MNGPASAAMSSPAFLRNRDPILAVLRSVLPPRGTLLEIASGSGEHAAYFAAAFPALEWQPTDRAADALASIAARHAQAGLANLRPPLLLDAAQPAWPVAQADAILAINMIHISPWRSAEGLFAGAARLLSVGAPLVLYGPFKQNGEHTADSNAAFDASLRARDPEWGVRDLEKVSALAQRHGFALATRVAMPANNLAVVFSRTAS